MQEFILRQVYNVCNNQAAIHLTAILGIFIAVYARVLGRDFFWVIDDLDGIAKYSEHFIGERKDDKTGQITPEVKVDSYEIDVKGAKKTVKFLSFIPELGFPGSILRFLRLQIGKEYRILGKNKNSHDVWGFVQSPRRHHILSMSVQAVNLALGYLFLSQVIPHEIAFAACILYAVHPLTTQSVAWISGIPYSLSMMFALATVNVALALPDLHYAIPLVAALSFLSGIVLYIGCFTWMILLFLKLYWLAVPAAVTGIAILFWKGPETKNFRIAAFKEQAMDATAYLNWRKPIVMVKTLFYYFRIVLFPVRMGLYHEWGYFYKPPIERPNGMFWKGVAVCALIAITYMKAGYSAQLGLVWFFAFFILFTNFITAQQFVADRYVTVPAFGICIVIASLLYPSPFFWILVGLYAMRTFCHLPTFRNEIDFYQSNFQNFRKSEVALGNLGVAYVNQGMPGSGVDSWFMATKVNPLYDVAWYNLYSAFKGNGRFQDAHTYLKNCLKGEVVHFKERWQGELQRLESYMSFNNAYTQAKLFFEQKNEAAEKAVIQTLVLMEEIPMDPAVPKEEFTALKARLAELDKPNSVQLHNPSV